MTADLSDYLVRPYPRDYELDLPNTFVLGVMVAAQLGAVLVSRFYYQGYVMQAGDLQLTGGFSNFAFSGGAALYIASASILFVLAHRYWHHIPDWFLKSASAAVNIGLIGGLSYYLIKISPAYFLGILVLVFWGAVFHQFQLLHILHTGWSILVASFMAGAIGWWMTPPVVAVFLVLMALWDYIAVDRTTIMSSLASGSHVYELGGIILIPNQLQIDLEPFKEWLENGMEENSPDSVNGVLGTGDLAIPTALLASTVTNTSLWLPVVGGAIGSIAGLVSVRQLLEREERMLPALPVINLWTLAGYTPFYLLAVVI